MSVSHQWSQGFYQGPERVLFFAVLSGTVLCLLLTCLVWIKDPSLNVTMFFSLLRFTTKEKSKFWCSPGVPASKLAGI